MEVRATRAKILVLVEAGGKQKREEERKRERELYKRWRGVKSRRGVEKRKTDAQAYFVKQGIRGERLSVSACAWQLCLTTCRTKRIISR